MIARVLPPLIWHIFQIIVDSFGLIVFACILNQSKVHWLLSDVLNSTISMSLKQGWNWFWNLWQLNESLSYNVWLPALERKLVGFWIFFSFLRKYEKQNPIICFLWCWTIGLKPFILCLHLLVTSKVRPL
jgi:hypothetical protein